MKEKQQTRGPMPRNSVVASVACAAALVAGCYDFAEFVPCASAPCCEPGEPAFCEGFSPHCLGNTALLACHAETECSGYYDHVDCRPPPVYPSNEQQTCVETPGGPPACAVSGTLGSCGVAGARSCDGTLLVECGEDHLLYYIRNCADDATNRECHDSGDDAALCTYGGHEPCDRPDDTPFACDWVYLVACDPAARTTYAVEDCRLGCEVDEAGRAGCRTPPSHDEPADASP
jgi:hypothetical protein